MQFLPDSQFRRKTEYLGGCRHQPKLLRRLGLPLLLPSKGSSYALSLSCEKSLWDVFKTSFKTGIPLSNVGANACRDFDELRRRNRFMYNFRGKSAVFYVTGENAGRVSIPT